MVCDYRPSSVSKWRLATVKARIGPKTYYVEVWGCGIWKRHADQIRRGGALKPRRDRKEEIRKFL